MGVLFIGGLPDLVYAVKAKQKSMKARIGKVKLCVPSLWDGAARLLLGFVKIVSWKGDADIIDLVCEWELFDEVDITGEIPEYTVEWDRTSNSVSMTPKRVGLKI